MGMELIESVMYVLAGFAPTLVGLEIVSRKYKVGLGKRKIEISSMEAKI
jgi:hypothetical protein